MEISLVVVKNSFFYFGIGVEGYFLRIFVNDNIFEVGIGGQEVISLMYFFSYGKDVKIVVEEVEIDIWLDKCVFRVESDFFFRQRL